MGTAGGGGVSTHGGAIDVGVEGLPVKCPFRVKLEDPGGTCRWQHEVPSSSTIVTCVGRRGGLQDRDVGRGKAGR